MKKTLWIAFAILAFSALMILSFALPLPSFEESLDEAAVMLMQKYRVPGCAMVVIEDGRIQLSKGYGTGDKARNNSIDENTVFQVGSISKTLTAWGIMKLVEEGLLDLDRPVDTYLTRWHLPEFEYNHQVTIRRILSHTAGLSVSSYAGYRPDSSLPTLTESLGGYGSHKGLFVAFEPGSYHYSGGGYTLLQLVIEETTGMPFSDYMEQEILRPLGMNGSTFDPGRIGAGVSKAYGILGQEMISYAYTERAAAGFHTTCCDLALFAMAEMAGLDGEPVGRGILKPESVMAMVTPATSMRKNNRFYGLGHVIAILKDGSRLVYHPGDNRGWHAIYLTSPEQRKGFVLLTNGDSAIPFYKVMADYWIASVTGDTTGLFSFDRKMERCFDYAAVFIAVLLSGYCFHVTGNFVKGKRRFLRFNESSRIWKKTIIRTSIILAAAVLWILLLYTGCAAMGWVPASFLPTGFKWITVEFLAFCFVSVVMNFCPSMTSNYSYMTKSGRLQDVG